MTLRPPVEDIVSMACRAPSVHNSQPWRWRANGDRIDLFADYRRQLVYADPARRDLLVSCGAALHHAQVASAALGWRSRVRRQPDPSDERHIASILLKSYRPGDEDHELLDALTRRRTDRRRLTSWPVPPERLNSLASVGASWGAQVLPVLGEMSRKELLRLTRRAARMQQHNHRYVDELAAWTLAEPVASGVPAGNRPDRTHETRDEAVYRRFPSGALPDGDPGAGDPEVGMLLVCTSSDDPISRIRAGEALSAVWLHATRDHLSVVPLSQAVEVDATRRELQVGVLGDLAFPQILLRVGWPTLSEEPPPLTPRRPLEEVLEIGDAG
jgi:nitroreductase